MPPHSFGILPLEWSFAFTVAAVVLCFLIYLKTRGVYELTKHEGVKHFRDAFLFFGLAYLVRFLLGIAMLSAFAFDFFNPHVAFEAFEPFFILLMGYFSTVATIYLVLGSLWKKFDNKFLLAACHGTAIALSVVSFVSRSHVLLLALQCILLAAAFVIGLALPKPERKFSRTKILYFLVAGLWLVNLLALEEARPIPFEAGVLFQAVSLAVFVVIYLRIAKWVK